LDAPVQEAFAVNFLDERQAPLVVKDGGIDLPLKAHQIQTIEIVRA
jgi:hypothetical protein